MTMGEMEKDEFVRKWISAIGGGDLVNRRRWRKEATADLAKLNKRTYETWIEKWGKWYSPPLRTSDRREEIRQDFVDIFIVGE